MGPKFFLMGISRVRTFFLVGIRGSKIFSRGYFVGPKFSRGSEIFSHGYFAGQNFFSRGYSWVQNFFSRVFRGSIFSLVVDFVIQIF